MSLEDKITLYKPTAATAELVRRAKIVFIVGIAGAGKDTVKTKLLLNPAFRRIVSHTTRQPRDNNGSQEKDGRDYHFISVNQAEKMIDECAFVEVKHVHGQTIYGTSAREIELGVEQEKVSLNDIDVQGVDEYKKISPAVVAIFLLPPSYKVWRQRLAKRYATSEEFEQEWPKRRQSAIRELEYALAVPYYHFIVNDQLDETVRIASEIAHKPDVFNRKDDEARIAARDILDELKRLS